jgi:ligand-binding sensor domain-containing protein/signal transduction histidine kinase
LRNSNFFHDPRADDLWLAWRRAFRAFTAGRSLSASACALLAGILFTDALIYPAYAIDPNRAMSQYVRETWGTDQGFPRGPVYAIAQTPDGYLWIGTEAGLVRFDGLNFRLVKDDSGAFVITSVLGLATDNDGCLWLRMEDLSILSYCHGRFEGHSSEPRPRTDISAMSRAIHGDLLVWQMEYGAFDFHGGGFRMLASASDLPRSPVTSLAQTPDGGVWIGTRDAGVFRIRGGTTLPIRNGLPDLKVNCLLPDGNGDLWIGTDNGIVRWKGSELTTAGIPESLKHVQALSMARDRDGNIWVGTDSRGLLRFNSQGVASLKGGDGVSRESITALFEDREGSLWIGSASGLERLRDSTFVTYSLPEGLPTDGSNPIFVDSENRLWFPPTDRGLWWVKDGQHGSIRYDRLGEDVVYSIAGKDSELWVGRKYGGLTQLHSEAGSFTAKTYTQADGLAQDSVYSVYETRDGSVWAGTLSGGVSKLSGGRFTAYTIANGLSSNTVASILESSDGTMWFATPSGLDAFSQGRWHAYAAGDGLPSENVNCLLEDSKGVLWVGTTAGLAFRGASRFQVPAAVPASLREQILGLAEDRYGSLWLATSNHVLRVTRDKLLQGALSEGDIREYGLADGLRGVEGVKRHQSVFRDPSGRIWFSLNRGISVVDPARLTSSSIPAIAHVQTISADGGAIDLQGPVHIPGGRERITFGYAGLSLSVPERVRFRYRLDGFDHGWSESVATREAVYTNLSPGSYRFRVIASNPDGIWGRNEATVGFDVDPLFWQTWWFRASVVIACAIAVLAIYRFRLHQVTRQLRGRFEERLAERTRIAQELHDTLLQGFLSASMQVHVAVDRLPSDSQVKPTLTRALQLMGQVIEEGRNAVRGLRSSQTASLDLEQAFSRIRDEMLADQIDFRVIVDGDRKPLHPLLRDEVYRIGREALLNAFRHAQAKSIEIELKYSSRQLRVFVRDDGRGIDPQLLISGTDGHWGLLGMRERADRIGARFHVFSNATAGTEIELSVPSHVAFVDESGRKLKWFGRRQSPQNTGSEAREHKNGKDA